MLKGIQGSEVLIVDDDATVIGVLEKLLLKHNLKVKTASTGVEALSVIQNQPPQLLISDIHMPKMDGFELCQKVRECLQHTYVPIIVMTGQNQDDDRMNALSAGADDFIEKPFSRVELLARVQSLLRIKGLYDTVNHQAEQLQKWNLELESRVQSQISQLEQLGRLKRFFSPKISDLILSSNSKTPLTGHRRNVTVCFVDLRGFTAFSEEATSENVMEVLAEYYTEVGQIAFDFEGTLGHIAADGMMIFFNDPIEVPDHTVRAVNMALQVRHALQGLQAKWHQRGFRLGFGIGLAEGQATIGGVGWKEFWHYTVIGHVANLAARLCQAAKADQILISDYFLHKIAAPIEAERLGAISLKGIHQPVTIHNILRRSLS